MSPGRPLPLLGLLLSSLPAQLAVPDHGAILFERVGGLEWLREGGLAAGGDADRLRCDPIVFAADVGDGGATLLQEPWSLSTLLVALALDPSWQPDQRFERIYDRVEPFGAVVVSGRTRTDRDGQHELLAQVSRRDLAPRDDDFLRVEQWYLDSRLGGQVMVRRRVDQDGTVIAFAFEVALDATRTHGESKVEYRVRGGEQWRRLEALPARYARSDSGPGFAQRVAVARAAALTALRRELGDPALQQDEGRGNVQGPSLLALRLSALARAGVRIDDQDAKAAFTALQQRELTVPSGIAFSLLAAGWLHAPVDERERRLGGHGPGQRAFDANARAFVTAQARRLLALRREATTGVFWSFAADAEGPDLRQTWLCVLALDEAMAAGVRVPLAVFRDVARHLCSAQVESGKAVVVATAGEYRGGTQGTFVPAGWMQDGRDHSGYCTAESTLGALAALAICQRRLRREHAVQPDIAAAIPRGLAWLQQHWTARHNGAPLPVHRQHEDLAAMALALASEALPLRLVGARDPYFELASVWLLRQRTDGVMPTSCMGTAASLWLWRDGPSGPITPR